MDIFNCFYSINFSYLSLRPISLMTLSFCISELESMGSDSIDKIKGSGLSVPYLSGEYSGIERPDPHTIFAYHFITN